MTGSYSEELKYYELFEMAKLAPNQKIVEYNGDFAPRIIPPNYIPEINYFSRQNDNLLYSLCLEQELASAKKNYSKKYFYSPSATLIATLMRCNEGEIREALGEKDSLRTIDNNMLEEIVTHLKLASLVDFFRENKEKDNNKANLKKYSYLQRKGLDNLIAPLNEVSIYYSGHAFNGKISSKSKHNIFYEVDGKQFISFDGNELEIPPFFQLRCGCGLSAASNLKYEFDEIVLMADIHTELARQALSYPELFSGRKEFYESPKGESLDKIENIFSPFKPLDNPSIFDKNLRKIIRRGLYNFIVSQDYIMERYDDPNHYHKNNGFTWFRCELDAYLLSFKQVYDKDFLKLWESNIDENLSEKKTCEFFGDYIKIGAERNDSITHFINKNKKTLEHRVNGKMQVVDHYAKRLSDNTIRPLAKYQLMHNASMNHELKGLNPDEYEVFHAQNIYEPIINFTTPFKAASIDNVNIYIAPYKMKKSR